MNKTNLINCALLLALAVVLMLSTVSCSGGIDRETADAFIEDFFDEMEQTNYGRAKSFLHTESMLNLDEYLKAVEQERGLDFSDGIEIEDCIASSKAYYDTQVKGSRYRVTLAVLIYAFEIR